MGLFDRFKKRVKEVAEEVDSEALTAVEDSEEGIAAIETSRFIEEDWEEETLEEEVEEPTPIESQDDDWDDWDDWDDEEDDIELPVVVSKKERKRLEKLEKQRAKELKRRKATCLLYTSPSPRD